MIYYIYTRLEVSRDKTSAKMENGSNGFSPRVRAWGYLFKFKKGEERLTSFMMVTMTLSKKTVRYSKNKGDVYGFNRKKKHP